MTRGYARFSLGTAEIMRMTLPNAAVEGAAALIIITKKPSVPNVTSSTFFSCSLLAWL